MQSQALQVMGEMAGSDAIMIHALCLGAYPGPTAAMLAREIDVIPGFVSDLR